ncbi:ComF family protein [Fundidesulfovibrio terrae]|uniref:ComF family protein n=1 Tax=Fundidesulfovibrio terrae TaxID=2922866 RepID=UPI001FAEA7F4|nr:ComF family protein [Fundidesulfovibrio terrae]
MFGLLRRLAGSRCLVCAAVTDGPGLCARCAEGLRPRLSGFCPGCGEMPEDEAQAVTLCAACRLTPRPWAALGFFGEYSGALRDAVLSLKFGGRLGSMGLLGDLARHAYRLNRERPGGFCAEGPEVVAAVPMHWRRLLTRGYNQSMELARAVAAGLGRPLALRALAKVRHTRPQSRLSARERKANLDGAFAADAAIVGGRRVLLVDDVMTTGSTLEAASRALLSAGADRVEVLVLARDRKRG